MVSNQIQIRHADIYKLVLWGLMNKISCFPAREGSPRWQALQLQLLPQALHDQPAAGQPRKDSHRRKALSSKMPNCHVSIVLKESTNGPFESARNGPRPQYWAHATQAQCPQKPGLNFWSSLIRPETTKLLTNDFYVVGKKILSLKAKFP